MSLLAKIFTRYCLICDQSHRGSYNFCSCCLAELPFIKDQCYQCAATLQDGTDSAYCSKCQDNPRVYNRICAMLQYLPPVTSLLKSLKFGGKRYIASGFAKLFADCLRTQYLQSEWPEVIIPVPLHYWRLIRRGYNQAEELAWHLSRHLQIKMDASIAKRVNCTLPQARLAKSKRRLNLTGAFEVKANNYQHVAIMDDVVTSTATVTELTRVLQASGITQVDVWAVARSRVGGSKYQSD